jgi:ArsR family transcriptional regulator, cadmium/lead-responsive transcriptional repressor
VPASRPQAPAPSTADEARAGAVFAALADPTRRHLVEALAAEPGATATGLAAALPISRQAVAKHLKLLGEAGLVSSRRSGREARFELDPSPLSDAAAWLEAIGAEWEERLGSLRRLLGS